MSSSVFNNISISVSDGESDDSSGKMRVHVRRKRKKLGFRWRILRKFARWWMILIFFPAVVVLFLQISIISVKQPKIESHLISHKESYENLDEIDARTRIVNGIREPCLKILKLEELQHLEFPMNDPPEIPVRRVIYRTNSDPSYDEAKGSFTQENIEASRFNLFTGFQTLAEREESFKVNETAMVHCGFYSENGGYNISDDDQNYMNSCKSVVSTCAFGGGDDLYQPIGMSKTSLEKVCYVAFWDEITLSTQEVAGKRIGKDGMIGNWRIVIVKDLPFSDQRLNGKIPKMLSHRLFPNARYSIWIDSKSQFRRDPLGVWEALLWRTNSVLAISEHGARSNVYDEGKAVVKKHKATPEEVEAQLSQYRHDGFPDDKRFNGKKALSEASVIVREHTPLSNLFMCLWFNEVVRFTSRDQLSFPYVFRRLKQLKINMFPVCTRKDLVNSMGHQRKVKPLIKPTPTTNTSLR